MSHNIAILGASGYTGAELARIVATHPTFEIVALAADRKAGMDMAEVYPHLGPYALPRLTRIEEIDFATVDLVFCALPHGTSQEVIAGLPKDLKIVDLSADFRIRDPAAYERWYGKPHTAPEMQAEAVYGLTEFYRDEIRAARFVAGTGCNAATGQYALRPLVAAGVIDLDHIIMDLKAATSGAGRTQKEHLMLSELYENVLPYAMGGTHRHLGEFDQELSAVAGREVRVQFAPHLIPAARGIVVTAYVLGDPVQVHDVLEKAYVSEPFVHVRPLGQVPAMKDARGSNHVHIGVVGDRVAGRATIVAVLDNLTKGSSGQAVQNANLMLGEDERLGLELAPLYP
ncbi:MAG: N-acetyl-gamma-glutamyl-phosphate reductase [Pseudomonadota bacterium]